MWVVSPCLASCCVTCACEACKSFAGGMARKYARIAYCCLFAMSLIIAWIMREYAAPLMRMISWINNFSHTPSEEWFETQAVMRVSLANFLFFMTLALLLIGVKDQRDTRDAWHVGGWMMKFMGWCTLIIFMFFLPNEIISVYEALSKFGSAVFLLMQVIILLDFTHNWNNAWVERDTPFWYIALLVASMFCYVATFLVSGFLLHWFNPSGQICRLNTFFIVMTLILAIAFAVISLLPKVNGSLLPASTMSLYCTYICYTGLSSEPRKYECNNYQIQVGAGSTGTLVMGMLTTVLSVVYSAVRAGSSTAFLSPPPSETRATVQKPLLQLQEDMAYDEDESEDIPQPIAYVYSFFHLIFALASMYSGMLLTSWTSAKSEDGKLIDVGWPSVWVRMCTQWFTAGLFIWSLVAPLVFPDRDFS